MRNSLIIFILISTNLISQVKIIIDNKSDNKIVSPFIYGKNNSVSSTDPTWILPSQDLVRLRDAGVTIFRESGGNNSTKYNWRKHLSSHPDWYNNVYVNNWDISAKTIQKNFPSAQSLFSFQLIGKAAKTNKYNFGDWDYNKSQWWEGVNQNLAGDGIPNSIGTKAKKEGDPNLYLENWNADSTTAILDYWFDKNGLALDKTKVKYWNMDNEVEIWNGTHDDIMPTQLDAEAFMQKYFEVAKKARAKYPDIKLVGPVTANEWQWYNWGKGITFEGKKYNWLEFFIKRIAEEQKATGIKLLDVFDIHFYPNAKNIDEITQLHRVFFDKDYIFPGANGVKNISGNWDNSQNKEYIFARINDWLAQYIGTNHGVKLGMTEIGIEDVSASATAVWYASTLGEFMKNEVELFTPWSWKVGMWETLHLFTKYNKTQYIKAVSDSETMVSAYPTINNTRDSITVILVNRSQTQQQSTSLSFNNFILGNIAKTYTLKSLPNTETFISNTQNALTESQISILNNNFSIVLPAMSVTSIVFSGKEGTPAILLSTEKDIENHIIALPNPSTDTFSITWDLENIEKLDLINTLGQKIQTFYPNKIDKKINIDKALPAGNYVIKLETKEGAQYSKKLVKQ